MMKRLASAAALSLFLAGAALAQAPAPSGEAPAPQATTATTAPEHSTEASAAATGNAAPAPTETGSIPQPAGPGTQAAAGTDPSAPAGDTATGAETAPVPDSVDSCIAAAADLGSSAESKTLAPENADHLDALFSKMETLCDGEKFADAVGVANDIRSIINAN